MPRPSAIAVAAWPAAFTLALFTHGFTNDHFHRLSSARQMSAFGEVPFRDFFDPGFLLTELSSVAMQRLFGDNLLGETLLNTAFIATGVVLVLLLARRASGSSALAVAAAALCLAAEPRAYDYDKVLSYPLGILLVWRWLDRGRWIDACALAGGMTLAGLFRYDNGVFIGAAAVAGLVALHCREWRPLVTQLARLTTVLAVLLVPVGWFLQQHGGIGNAIDQMVTYALREGTRTRMLMWPPLSVETLFAYYLVVALPIAAAIALLGAGRPLTGRREPDDRYGRAKAWSVVALCVVLDLFILRDPVTARIGGVAGPAAVLAAWLAGRAWPLPRLARVAVAVVSLATLATVDVKFDDPVEALRARAVSPPPRDAVPSELRGIVDYLRACTAPSDRVLAAWFVPELYFHAQRGFAAGMVVMFGGHWSEMRFQERSVEILAAQSAPIVIVQTRNDLLAESYPLLDAFVRERYRVAGETNFGDPQASPAAYRVLVRADRAAAAAHEASGLPCFARP